MEPLLELFRMVVDVEEEGVVKRKGVGQVCGKAMVGLRRPDLPAGEYTFYFTRAGYRKFKPRVLDEIEWQRILGAIVCEKPITLSQQGIPEGAAIVYQDEYQVVIKTSTAQL